MAIIATTYAQFLLDLGAPSGLKHSFPSNDVKVALLTSAYTPNYNSDTLYDAVATHEVADEGSSGGYMSGGISLFNTSWTFDSATRSAVLNADPVGWGSLAGTFRYAVIYNGANNLLIGAIDYGEDKIYSDEPFEIAFPNGVISVGAA